MSTTHTTDNPLPINDGLHDVAGDHIGKRPVNVFRKSFTLDGKMQNGDYYVNRSRLLIQQFNADLPNDAQETIREGYQSAIGASERVESVHGIQKFLKAKEYQEAAKRLFAIVKNTLSEATDGEADEGTGPALETTSTIGNPFCDSDETTSLVDADVGNWNQLEMTIYESDTDEAAVVLGLRGRDGSAQEVGTIPFVVGPNPWCDLDTTFETAT